jgi:hypothetical protein
MMDRNTKAEGLPRLGENPPPPAGIEDGRGTEVELKMQPKAPKYRFTSFSFVFLK